MPEMNEDDKQFLEDLAREDTGGYIRISSDKQDPMSCDAQEDRMRDFAEANNIVLRKDRIYREEDPITGTNIYRPALQRLIADVKNGKFRCERLLFWDTSRLSRDFVDALLLAKEFRLHGIRVHFIADHIDTGDENSFLVLVIKALGDAGLITKIREHTKSGLRRLFDQKLSTGGQVYGYRSFDVDGHRKLRIYQPEAEIVRLIYSLAAKGWGHRTIADYLNKMDVAPPGVSRRLTQESPEERA
jgi:site-specific DNA recombinase